MDQLETAMRAAIKSDRYDRATRLQLADLLEETDRPEEAMIHRRWTEDGEREAQAWLLGFADQINLKMGELLTACQRWVETGESYGVGFNFGPQDISDGNNREMLWRCYGYITDCEIAEGKQGDPFRCCEFEPGNE